MMRRTRQHEAGFTLMELIIVMSIISILAALAVPRFTAAIKSAHEAVLREDLRVMRTAIDSYTMDKQKAPQSLDDLLNDGYLRSIPEDPMTHSRDTWVPDSSDAYSSVDQTEPGITDVHSGSQEIGSDNRSYSEW
ncbi:MAG TPA: type II secretion system protein [Terracidiphilus sp.]|nr:type II secretion system protein [Terracidiphilus sp.]